MLVSCTVECHALRHTFAQSDVAPVWFFVCLFFMFAFVADFNKNWHCSDPTNKKLAHILNSNDCLCFLSLHTLSKTFEPPPISTRFSCNFYKLVLSSSSPGFLKTFQSVSLDVNTHFHSYLFNWGICFCQLNHLTLTSQSFKQQKP